MYSVNNALQKRDFLSVEEMAPITRRLNAADESSEQSEPHGSEKYGAYSVSALHEALRAKGHRLRYLNVSKTFRCSKKKWFRKIISSRYNHLVIIGRASGQEKNTWHCIARATVGEKRFFIDSDEFVYKPNTEPGLKHFFAEVSAVYAIETNANPSK